MAVYLTPPPGSPITRAIAAIIGAIMLVGAFMLGIVAFVIALGVSLLAGAWLWFRSWRFSRNQPKNYSTASGQKSGQSRPGNPAGGGDIIEAEYTVVSQEDSANSDQKPQG